MGGRLRLTVLLGIAVLLGAAAVVLVHQARQATPASSDWSSGPGAVVLGQAVHVESGVPRTSFLPLGSAPEDERTLSAQHAYDLLVSGSAKLNPIPATVRAYYGLLTDPSAPTGPVHVRVWAFAVESACCRLWEFVDARTGRDLGPAAREVLPD